MQKGFFPHPPCSPLPATEPHSPLVGEEPARLDLLYLMAVHPNTKETVGLGEQMFLGVQMSCVPCGGDEFASLMFLIQQPMLGIFVYCSPRLQPLVTHTPVFSWAEPASQCAFLRVPKTLLLLNGRCVSVAEATRVLSGCGLSWYSWSPGTNVSAQGAVFLCGLHLWHLMGLREVEL